MARVTAAAREVALLERAEANLRRMQLGRPHDVVVENHGFPWQRSRRMMRNSMM